MTWNTNFDNMKTITKIEQAIPGEWCYIENSCELYIYKYRNRMGYQLSVDCDSVDPVVVLNTGVYLTVDDLKPLILLFN